MRAATFAKASAFAEATADRTGDESAEPADLSARLGEGG